MIAFISSLAINGIPFGSSPLEIVSLAVFFLGLFAVLIIGLFLKKDKLFMITTIIYTAISVLLIMYVEASCKDYILSGIGFLPGLGLLQPVCFFGPALRAVSSLFVSPKRIQLRRI